MTLASLVQVNMASKDSGRLNAINEVLDTVATSLTQQSSSNEATIQGQRGWCSDEVATLTGQLETATHDLETYQKEDADLSEEKVNEQAALDNETKDLATNQENKASSEKNLEDENARFDQAVKDYANAIAACEQSLVLLKTLSTNPAGFI